MKYLRPARETCEQCHWPQRFSGDKFIVKTSYKEDEKNTPMTTALLMKIGGHTWQGGTGIHGRHLDAGSRIRYISTDDQRQVIPVVYYTDDNGKTVEYVSTDTKVSKEQLEKGEHRMMDCIDCHNRPTHAFELPENAVDNRMSRGLVSPQLPYIRKKAVELLKADYPDRETAKKKITDGITGYYRTNYPDIYNTKRAVVEQSADNVAAIYMRNIFPEHEDELGRASQQSGPQRRSGLLPLPRRLAYQRRRPDHLERLHCLPQSAGGAGGKSQSPRGPGNAVIQK